MENTTTKGDAAAVVDGVCHTRAAQYFMDQDERFVGRHHTNVAALGAFIGKAVAAADAEAVRPGLVRAPMNSSEFEETVQPLRGLRRTAAGGGGGAVVMAAARRERA